MAGILVSPGFDDMVRKRSAVYKRNNSPNFKDILRKRCKERIKAKRVALMDQFRCLDRNDEVREILSQMVREEATLLTTGQCGPMDQDTEQNNSPVSKEPVDEKEIEFQEWLLEEYEAVLVEVEERELWEEHVVCPLCWRGALSEAGVCPHCSATLPPASVLRSTLPPALAAHDALCQASPAFSLIPDPTISLYLICHACSSFMLIT